MRPCMASWWQCVMNRFNSVHLRPLKRGRRNEKRKEQREGWKILNWYHCGPVSKLLVTHIISAQARWLPKCVWLCKVPNRESSGFSSACALLAKQDPGAGLCLPRGKAQQCAIPSPSLKPCGCLCPVRAFCSHKKLHPEVLSKGSCIGCGIGPGDL